MDVPFAKSLASTGSGADEVEVNVVPPVDLSGFDLLRGLQEAGTGC